MGDLFASELLVLHGALMCQCIQQHQGQKEFAWMDSDDEGSDNGEQEETETKQDETGLRLGNLKQVTIVQTAYYCPHIFLYIHVLLWQLT